MEVDRKVATYVAREIDRGCHGDTGMLLGRLQWRLTGRLLCRLLGRLIGVVTDIWEGF